MADPVEETRTFIALNFTAEFQAAVAGVISQLKAVRGRISWVRPEGVHLTLKFLGNVSLPKVAQLSNKLSGIAREIPPFQLQLAEIGVFPDKGRPRVLWWGLRCDTPYLTALFNYIERKLLRCGFPRESRPFTPHLTLGRIRELRDPRELPELLKTVKLPCLSPVEVDAVALMQSTLSGGGAVYTELAAFPLSGAGE